MFADEFKKKTLPPDEFLAKDQLFELRDLLLGQAQKIIDASQGAVQELTAEREQEADAVDVASSEADREFTLRVAGRERLMLNKINYALSRMERGEYGECESCGEFIGHKRLLARPVATRCIDCKTREEQLEGGRRNRAF
jgi:DnaK suppressor protein